jgi:quercetin dioxygenase-like cupin family protein
MSRLSKTRRTIMSIESSSFSRRSLLATANQNGVKHVRYVLAEPKLSARFRRPCFVALAPFYTVVALVVAGVSAGFAQEHETVNPVFQSGIPNIQGKNLVALVVNYPPGGKSLPHRHAKSAFVYAYVLAGAIRSGVDTEPAKVYQMGEGFHEVPGAHHRVSENASNTQPASLLAIFIVDAEDEPLTISSDK